MEHEPSNIFEAVMIAGRLSLAETLLSFAENQYDLKRPQNRDTMEKYIQHAEQIASSGRIPQEQIGNLSDAIARIREAIAKNAKKIR